MKFRQQFLPFFFFFFTDRYLLCHFFGEGYSAVVTSPNRPLHKLLSLDSQLTPCWKLELQRQLELCLLLSKGEKKKMKLGKVEFCHLLQIIALFLCLSGMNQAEPSRSRSKPYFQSGRTRTKRSWVWNQFFVLEEYMGTDPLYVGKVGDLTKHWKVQMPAF